MKNQISYSPEVRERAVKLVFEQQKEHIAMVGDEVDCIKDWLYSGDVANVGKTNRD